MYEVEDLAFDYPIDGTSAHQSFPVGRNSAQNIGSVSMDIAFAPTTPASEQSSSMISPGGEVSFNAPTLLPYLIKKYRFQPLPFLSNP
jgi:hypothetical protein